MPKVDLQLDDSIVALDRFIQSTRDSGYKSTSSAIAELVDNAIQADADKIAIEIGSDQGVGEITVRIVDNGVGMTAATLIQALRFGGSSRYGNRSGLGRFGMGLPNASLSQAKRVTAITWQKRDSAIQSYLDVDEIASGELSSVPRPERVSAAVIRTLPNSSSGTVILWEKCDRLDNRRISTLERKLASSLGKMFRHYLWGGISITINGEAVEPRDPLLIRGCSKSPGATLFGEEVALEVYSDASGAGASGIVKIRFSELPVKRWQGLSNEEKRQLGISNGAGISIVRSGREVDFGWFFLNGKRRENYDDWWRCEICFEPVLDDAFGITHTKQQIRPQEFLIEAISPFVETTAKALNSRVRQSHFDSKVEAQTVTAVDIASKRDSELKPLQRSGRKADRENFEGLAKRHAGLNSPKETQKRGTIYHILEDDLDGAIFYKPVVGDSEVCAVINPRHSFYKQFYRPIMETAHATGDNGQASLLQLVLLAAARAEATFISAGDRKAIEAFRAEWSSVLETLLRN